MDTDWMEIYRSKNYSDDDLVAEFTELKKQAGVFTQQAEADKSYTKSLTEVKNRMQAIVRVQNERATRPHVGENNRRGVMDFSGLGTGQGYGYPHGREEW